MWPEIHALTCQGKKRGVACLDFKNRMVACRNAIKVNLAGTKFFDDLKCQVQLTCKDCKVKYSPSLPLIFRKSLFALMLMGSCSLQGHYAVGRENPEGHSGDLRATMRVTNIWEKMMISAKFPNYAYFPLKNVAQCKETF